MPENQEKKDLGQQKFLFFHKPDENQRIRLEKNLLGEKETKKEPENEERAPDSGKAQAASGKNSRFLNLCKGILLLAGLFVVFFMAGGGKPDSGETGANREAVKDNEKESASLMTEEDGRGKKQENETPENKNSRLLRVVMRKKEGFSYTDGDGTVRGLDVDFIERLSEDLGFDYELEIAEFAYSDYLSLMNPAFWAGQYDVAFIEVEKNSQRSLDQWGGDFSEPYLIWNSFTSEGEEWSMEYRIGVAIGVEDRDALIKDINECILCYQSDGTMDGWREKWEIPDEKPEETETGQTGEAGAERTGGGWVGLSLRKKMLEEQYSKNRQQEEELNQLSEQIQKEIQKSEIDLGTGSETMETD